MTQVRNTLKCTRTTLIDFEFADSPGKSTAYVCFVEIVRLTESQLMKTVTVIALGIVISVLMTMHHSSFTSH